LRWAKVVDEEVLMAMNKESGIDKDGMIDRFAYH